MARDPDYDAEEEETAAKPKAAKKKSLIKKKENPAPQQPAVIRIPVFESQAQQVFYDELLAIRQEIGMIRADIDEIKKMAEE